MAEGENEAGRRGIKTKGKHSQINNVPISFLIRAMFGKKNKRTFSFYSCCLASFIPLCSAAQNQFIFHPHATSFFSYFFQGGAHTIIFSPLWFPSLPVHSVTQPSSHSNWLCEEQKSRYFWRNKTTREKIKRWEVRNEIFTPDIHNVG